MNNSFRFSAQFVFGVSIIILGLLFTLDNLELIEAREFLRFWPAIFVIVGLVKLVQPGGTPAKVFGAALVLVGSLMILNRLDIIDFNVWRLWPVFIILIGYSVLRSATERKRVMEGRSPAPSDSDSYIKAMALMGGVVRSTDSQDFRGGELTAVMGGCEIDLRRASIKEGEARLEIFAFWGGVELKVPEDWAVIVQVTPIMGGVEDKSVPPKGGASKKLVITGHCIMGGAEVRN
jgi:predicted membrane protein